MGVVYEASERQLNRRVALKVLPFTASSDSRLVDRLHHEAQIVARLSHPHIVTVYGSGECDGVHFIAFQFIDGPSLDKSLKISRTGPDDSSSATRQRPVPPKIHWRWMATLGRDVADALQHAHEQGIIHRDIKPSNLLLDSTGKIWVTDFGLAMASGLSQLTATGDLLGTLRYMSPEQATGQRGVVDRRTDLYSLGITLYEMATGRSAYSGQDRAALLKQILFDAPMPIHRQVPSIPRDLATIIGKATAKLPSERYFTAREFAADLQRFLDGRPIVAQPPTISDRIRHFGSRYRLPLTITVTALFLLLAAWNAITQRHSSQLADQIQLLSQSQRETLKREWETLISAAQRGRLTSAPGRRQQGLASLEQATRLLPQLNLTFAEKSQLRDEWIATLAVPLDLVPQSSIQFEHSVFSAAVDDRFQYCVRAASTLTAVDLFSLDTSQGDLPPRELAIDPHGSLYYFFGSGGNYLATETLNGNECVLSVWETATGKRTVRETGWNQLIAWKEDGRTLAFISLAGNVKIVDATTGTVAHEWTFPTAVTNYAWRPGHSQVAIVSRDLATSRVSVCDASWGTVLEEQVLPFPLMNIEWHSSGRFLICQVGAGRGEKVVVWDWVSRREQATLPHSLDRYLVPTTGDLIATESISGESIVWNAVLGQEVSRVLGRPVAFASNGKRFATCTSIGLHQWEIVRSDVFQVFAPALHFQSELTDVGLSPDGRWLAVTANAGIALLDTQTHREIDVPLRGGRCAQFVQSGDQLLLVSSHAGSPDLVGSGVSLEERSFHPENGTVSEPVTVFPVDRPALYGHGAGRVAGSSRFWAIANGGDELVIVDRESKQVTPVGSRPQLTNGTVSPDGRWAVSGFFHGEGVPLWDVSRGTLDRILWDVAGAASVEFSPDGKWLAVSTSHETRVFETTNWTVALTRPRTDSSDICIPIAFSPDSRLLVLTENQWDLDLYELPPENSGDRIHPATWNRVARLGSPEPAYGGMARFSADGRFLARANWSQVQLWNLESLKSHLREQGLAW